LQNCCVARRTWYDASRWCVGLLPRGACSMLDSRGMGRTWQPGRAAAEGGQGASGKNAERQLPWTSCQRCAWHISCRCSQLPATSLTSIQYFGAAACCLTLTIALTVVRDSHFVMASAPSPSSTPSPPCLLPC
jgi:hypothetical protein